MAQKRSVKVERSSGGATSARVHAKGKVKSPREVSASITKGFRIIELLAEQREKGLSLVDISSQLGIPKSTMYRYLETFVGLGLAERDSNDRFHLGTKLIELTGSFLSNNDLHTQSSPFLDELAETTGETVHLAVASLGEVVYIAKRESIHAVRMYTHLGAQLPLHATALGKVILAYFPATALDEFLSGQLPARTPKTISSATALMAELDRVREQGFAIDDEESETGVRCVGAAVFDYSKAVVAAISISGPVSRMSLERCHALGPVVQDAARRMSRRIGFPG